MSPPFSSAFSFRLFIVIFPKVVFEYSFWWALPVVLIAFAAAYSKYRKLAGLPDVSRGVAVSVASLRFLTSFALLFLLLHPALSLWWRVKEKPLLVVAQDNSASVAENKDSLYYRNEYRASLSQGMRELEEKFDVVRLTFGAQVRRNGEVDFSEKRTDLSAVFDYVARNFAVRKPAGMVLLTDGVYNAGVNPVYGLPAFPVHTVALGDSTRYPDVYVQGVEANKFTFLNTVFPLRAEVAATLQKGKRVKCVLQENGNTIDSREVVIDRDNFLAEVVFEVEAKRKGVVRYTVVVEAPFAERSVENNRAETWIHVIDNSAEIAVFATAPHPDIAAIVNAVEVAGIYKCTEHRWTERFDTLKANLVILHNPQPNTAAYRQLMAEAERRKIAVWQILTNREAIVEMGRYSHRYTTDYATALNEYAEAGVNRAFPYFEFSDEEAAGIAKFPPVVVPFGELRTGAGKVLLSQRIKHTTTGNGMMAFYEQNGFREAYFWGEGLWRWRLYSYLENGSHALFNTLVQKVVTYLANRKGADRFVHDIKTLYDETEEVVMNVELYNRSYEPVNSPDVNLELSVDEKRYHYLFGRNGDKYRLNLGNLPAGEYAYRLSTDLKGEPLRKQGTFYVRNHNPELNNLVANLPLLKEIAGLTGGEAVSADELGSLVGGLNRNGELRPVYRSEVSFVELNEMKVIGMVLLLLLCIEWFLLKYFAG